MSIIVFLVHQDHSRVLDNFAVQNMVYLTRTHNLLAKGVRDACNLLHVYSENKINFS